MRRIEVVDYDPHWPEVFETLRQRIWAALGDVALSVEHVGSTSVPGLAAKPIIDISIVIPERSDVQTGISRLASLGYVHRGDLGIEGREAFANPDGLPMHNLYLCPRDSVALANHLAIRNYLRTHARAVRGYGELKKQLAERFPNDIDGYIDGKTTMLLTILRRLVSGQNNSGKLNEQTGSRI
jgi:GrpB-like predicted nucleotidyltransferase (UPF0157 family)